MSGDANALDPALRDQLEDPNGPSDASSATPSRPTADAAAATAAEAHLQQPDSPDSTRSDHHGASYDDSPHNDASGHGLGDDAKRSRACEACRGLKVRCVPDPEDNDGPCLRCRKARRNCVVTQPTRKRQKKTDSRVAELEKKIDALTASLHARGSTNNTAHQGRDAAPAPSVVPWEDPRAGEREQHSAMRRTNDGYVIYQPRYERDSGPASSTPVVTGQKRKLAERGSDEGADGEARGPPPIRMDEAYDDVVQRGILTHEKAEELFARYNGPMVRHLPAVVFPPGMTVTDLRTVKPVLFLAVMAAASGETSSLQRQLVRELMQVLAEKIVITGEKSLELVQALQVAVIWYWPPEHYEELKFYQLVHMGAVMAIDLGLGRRLPGKKSVPYGVYAFRRISRRTTVPDPTTLEARRAWLACYFLSSNTAMALQRPLLVRWTRFMAESMELLKTSPDNAPTDEYFCALVWTHRISEDIGQQFAMDDPDDAININEPRTIYALRKLERDLEVFQKSLPKELMQDTLKISFGIVSLYMHEIVLHGDTGSDDKQQQNQQQPTPAAPPTIFRDIIMSDPSTATTAHVNAISACLTNIDTVLEAFLAMDIPSIRCLPVFNFVRVAYALVVLIKIYFSASHKDSELSDIINKEELRVDFYIDGLLHKFRGSAAEDRSRPGAKFLVVLVMLKAWFVKQGQQGSGGDSGASPAPKSRDSPPASAPPEASQQPHQQQQQQQQHMANTPLHLLSEIATNDRSRAQTTPSNSNNNNNNGIPWGFNLRQASQQQPPFMFDANGADASLTTPSPATGDAATTPNLFPGGFPGGGADFSPFNVNDLTQTLSMEELASSLGLGSGAGLPGAGPGFLGSYSSTGVVNAAAALEPAMAQDPWFGQWGDALGGMPPPGSGPTGGWGGMPPFQM